MIQKRSFGIVQLTSDGFKLTSRREKNYRKDVTIRRFGYIRGRKKKIICERLIFFF